MASSTIPLQRLQQTQHHLAGTSTENPTDLSIVHGELEPPLRDLTLGSLLDEQCEIRGDKECLVVAHTGVRWTYSKLQQQSRILAKGLLAVGLEKGDRIGILASNCEEYAATFFAAGYLGCILVVLNATYTAEEALHALKHSGCKVLFIEEKYGRHSNAELLSQLSEDRNRTPELKTIATLHGTFEKFTTYSDVKDGLSSKISVEEFEAARRLAHTHDVCNLQYTSGSTGHPKAAMLTHHNLINNARFIGHRMSFTSADVLCCPPPLFHCFGLVLGLLTCLSHGASIILPSPTFSAPAVLSVLSSERVTALHGVPAMFEELLSLPRPSTFSCPHLRTGIIAGAPVPKPLMERLFEELNMTEFTSSYGLTEASPTCFNATCTTSIERRLNSVGKVMPHMHCKIVARDGRTVRIGERGELCMAGYSLQKGYWMNEEKTKECMVRDESGVLWLHTGDEAVFDAEGYCTITGRFKDIIIRGGENIYPVEIESRLTSHPSGHVSRSAVVGIPHHKYGEVVVAFLLPSSSSHWLDRPTDDELRVWVRQALGWHKAPVHVFWFGDEEVGMDEVPQTGSGKVKKHVLRKVGEEIVQGLRTKGLEAKEKGKRKVVVSEIAEEEQTMQWMFLTRRL
ncbi:related to long-chain-fatty-acid-CoA ligase [Rhynchosporium graminicola]|uniref:Related to long-chain-fatty-acid-CoA ligase n=1 Tax=Rhynchosporium graminicola TaxID=2792576 RepID=A0A1E1K3S8_9HELO|nr:related to long-chain-fatty-acid-CoA ligase [Rhynchosporium commune]